MNTRSTRRSMIVTGLALATIIPLVACSSGGGTPAPSDSAAAGGNFPGTDPEAFPDPDINIEAESRKQHHTFGGGVHHCLGHYIARADMSIAIPMLAENFTNITCPGGDEWLPDSGNHGPIRLPISLDVR